MRSFVLQQVFPVPPAEVMQAQLHPGLNAFLLTRVPDLLERTELSRTTRGDVVELRTRCVPAPRIPEVARAVVRPELITWVEEARVDLVRGQIRVDITPAGFRDIFRFKGAIQVTAQGTGSLRRVEASVEIRMLFVGGLVEDYLVQEIRRNMAAEGDALVEFVVQGRHRAAT
ncbi:MAG: DUF2505 family protein [Deltaproteobacteria bacterium]|nr:DUF2505 family protein [Deltaproteobacteria bacterium]